MLRSERNEGDRTMKTALDAATGKTVIRVNPKWFRPADVGSLLGDPTKAKTVLGWDPQKTSYTELVRIMAEHDRALARQEAMQRGR
ncbi:GDP-mannose 4,6-dehydratase [Anaeromassilibacillus senegalensis]